MDHKRPKFAFSCVAAQFEKAQALAAALAICADFEDFSAVSEHETVHRVFVEDGGDQYDGEARRHVVTVMVGVCWRRGCQMMPLVMLLERITLSPAQNVVGPPAVITASGGTGR